MRSGARWSGLTAVEVLVVVAGLATLAGLGFPRIRHALLEARAGDVVADLEAVRDAALRYHRQTGTWPPETGPGSPPPELAGLLPAGVSFDDGDRVLDWESWSGPDAGFVGIVVTTGEEELAAAVFTLLEPGATWSDGRTRVALVVAWR